MNKIKVLFCAALLCHVSAYADTPPNSPPPPGLVVIKGGLKQLYPQCGYVTFTRENAFGRHAEETRDFYANEILKTFSGLDWPQDLDTYPNEPTPADLQKDLFLAGLAFEHWRPAKMREENPQQDCMLLLYNLSNFIEQWAKRNQAIPDRSARQRANHALFLYVFYYWKDLFFWNKHRPAIAISVPNTLPDLVRKHLPTGSPAYKVLIKHFDNQ